MRTIVVILLVCGLASCVSSKQYLTISSEQAVKNEVRDLVFENDSVRVTYRFNGWPGPLTLTVENQSSLPVEINWRKSAFILEGVSRSYFSPDFNIRGDIRLDTARNLFGSSPRAGLEGTVTGDIALEFMPPHTTITRKWNYLPGRKLGNISVDTALSGVFPVADQFPFKYKKLQFHSSAAPMAFRSFLTFQFPGGKEVYQDHQFYVSELWVSPSSWNYLPAEQRNRGDLFSL